MSFKSDIDRINDRITSALDRSIRAATLQLGTAIIKETPFDTGRARGNWQTSIGSPVSGETARLGAAGSIAELSNQTGAMIGDVLYITNNVPYIYFLEYGSSQLAPEGMVRRNIQKFNRVLVAKIRQEIK